MIELGAEVRDTITGFKGIAMARAQYMTGCATIKVQPKADRQGKLADAVWCDEPTLEVMKPAPKPEPVGVGMAG